MLEKVGVSTIGVRAMLAGFAAIGLDIDGLCAAAGIERTLLADPDRRLLPPTLFRLWTLAADEYGGPDIGLRTGAAVPFGAFEVLDYLLMSSATVGGAVSQACRYLALLTTIVRYEVRHDGDALEGGRRAELVPRIPLLAVPVRLRDFSVAVFRRRLAEVSSGVAPVRVELTGPGLAPAAAYREVLGCEVRFQQRGNALVISGSDWDRPLPRRDAGLCGVLARHAEELIARVPRSGMQERVRREVIEALRDGEPTMTSIARTMGMSTRTLHRRLADEGTTLSEIVDDTRRELALRYLREAALSISEVGLLLGYSEPSAFNRAFKRWTGASPSAHRRSGAARK